MRLSASGYQLAAQHPRTHFRSCRILKLECHQVALCVNSRTVVQSSTGGGVRSLLDQYEDYNLAKRLKKNRNGNYYRLSQKLWPSQEALEKSLTDLTYHPVERQPLALLARREMPRQVFACEGRGGTALLEALEHNQKDGVNAEAGNALAPNQEAACALTVDSAVESDVDFMEALLKADQSVNSKILTEADTRGTMLESSRARAELILERDLTENTVLPLRVPQASSDTAGTSWSALGLDPLVSRAAEQLFGPAPTRLQARLLPALLNEDHNDVLFNGVTGSGKTSALLLAILHGIRNEEASMNVLVTTSTMNAMRMHATVKALCERVGGGALVDRPADDYSWLLIGTYREDYETYYRRLRRGLRSKHGPARLLITTADVLCELLFEKKMEFESFGYLRRVYVDDVGAQVPMIDESAPVAEARERLRNPLAAELLLGTLHQMPGPHIRSVLQLGMVSADVDGKLKDHLQALCMKPIAQTTVLSTVRIPSTVHCLFSFYIGHRDDRFAYLARLVWNARETIPGRVVIFISDTEDVLGARRRLRGLGMDVKLFSEVYGNQRFQDHWKFLILKESEAFGVDLPLVSHVFITFAPTTWQRYLHMCGRTGRLGNVGWVYTVCDQLEAKIVRQAAEALSVDFCNHVLDVSLNQVPAKDMERQTKQPELYGLDPQYAVRQHYEVQAENPDMAYRKRELFSKPAVKQFQMEDYTPMLVKQRRFNRAQQLSRDIERNPSLVIGMQRKGMLDAQLKPTKRLRRYMDLQTSKQAPDPFAKKPQQ
ncbi:ATP dependent DEAD-box helicase putative (RH) [Leptomonas seymouri]|uniref:ATP-dependent RNA helicase n=1 Tax=Leptomonas seymouri TaxID=5684 RepID=A0A0N1IC11_LEPSE|nr:ATP dependent DEAD-box helicase putative (RH) [Leptomonas seymouri]|eukprot:KPI90443.1 ATP dependent DEAD-box helicase putative (RH) [Leptomonas seymouri]